MLLTLVKYKEQRRECLRHVMAHVLTYLVAHVLTYVMAHVVTHVMAYVLPTVTPRQQTKDSPSSENVTPDSHCVLARAMSGISPGDRQNEEEQEGAGWKPLTQE